jgi:formate dehydrogenase gamma subunit
VAGAVALLAAAAAGRGWAEAVPDETCLGCHSDRAITRSRAGAPPSVYVNGAELAASVHRGLACANCHADAAAIPHAPHLQPVRCEKCHQAVAATIAKGAHATVLSTSGRGCVACHGTHAVRPASRTGLELCASCHAAEARDFVQSVHGRARAQGDLDAATCVSCHGGIHSVRAHSDPESPTHRAHLAETCGRCHADRALMEKRKITIPRAYELYRQSVHGRSANPRAATCNDCHESHHLLAMTDPASSIYRANIPATCGRCHAREAAAYDAGVHAVAMRRGVASSPVCTDCHGEHLIRGPHDPDSPVRASAVTTTCSRCHEAQEIRETFGLPAGRLSTYQDSYHGLAARGGSPVVAHCASCHGYHDILPSSDPRSAVSPQRLPQTCGKCHAGAGTRFAMGPVHVAMATPDNPVLFMVRRIYLLLIVATIGGMLFHNGLDFASKLRSHWRLRAGANPAAAAALAGAAAGHHEPVPEGRWFVRMTRFERVQHLLLAISFFTLVFTGFALKFPESWMFAWLARLEHGYSWRSLIHRGAAIVMVTTSLVHIVYLFTPRGRGVLLALMPRLRDAREASANLFYMLGLRRQPPRFDRFGYIEKAEYWALIWGTVVMTVTGMALWFENQSLQWLTKWMLDLATIVHYYEAWLAFLAIMVWHIYQNVVNPDVYPMNWSWISGRVSEEQLRHEHPAEWERSVAATDAAPAAAAEPVEPPSNAIPPQIPDSD